MKLPLSIVSGLALIQIATASSSSFTFDGSSSDMAQQFRNLYEANFAASALSLSSVPSDVTARLQQHSLEFADLPPLLQRAVLWDTGYVAPYNEAASPLVAIFTSCDSASTMADIAISKLTYDSTTCTALACTSLSSYRSQYCTGKQMASVSLCAATDTDSAMSSSMWATGGSDEMLPVPNVVRHNWTDPSTSISYLMYAIHMVEQETEYKFCPSSASNSAMIIPCVPYNSSDTIKSDWCRPSAGAVVNSWLLEEAQSDSSSRDGSINSSSSNGSTDSSSSSSSA